MICVYCVLKRRLCYLVSRRDMTIFCFVIFVKSARNVEHECPFNKNHKIKKYVAPPWSTTYVLIYHIHDGLIHKADIHKTLDSLEYVPDEYTKGYYLYLGSKTKTIVACSC